MMGKNRRKQILYLDKTHKKYLNVDSNEEVDFLKWLDEAVSL